MAASACLWSRPPNTGSRRRRGSCHVSRDYAQPFHNAPVCIGQPEHPCHFGNIIRRMAEARAGRTKPVFGFLTKMQHVERHAESRFGACVSTTVSADPSPNWDTGSVAGCSRRSRPS
jgi:hypothetical protein